MVGCWWCWCLFFFGVGRRSSSSLPGVRTGTCCLLVWLFRFLSSSPSSCSATRMELLRAGTCATWRRRVVALLLLLLLLRLLLVLLSGRRRRRRRRRRWWVVYCNRIRRPEWSQSQSVLRWLALVNWFLGATDTSHLHCSKQVAASSVWLPGEFVLRVLWVSRLLLRADGICGRSCRPFLCVVRFGFCLFCWASFLRRDGLNSCAYPRPGNLETQRNQQASTLRSLKLLVHVDRGPVERQPRRWHFHAELSRYCFSAGCGHSQINACSVVWGTVTVTCALCIVRDCEFLDFASSFVLPCLFVVGLLVDQETQKLSSDPRTLLSGTHLRTIRGVALF